MNPSQLKLSQLKYFLDVAETCSFTKAAEKNFTSQSNVSYAMRELEKTLNLPLFIRRNNELMMTRYGEMLLPYVVKAFSELENGCRNLEQMSNPESGKVKIAFSFIFSLASMPDLLRFIFLQSAKDYVKLDLQSVMVHKGDEIEIVEDRILDGSCDLGLTCVRVREEIESVVVCQKEHVLLLPKTHPLAGAKKLRLQDVKDDPFILISSDSEDSGNWYMNLFKEVGLTPNLIHPGMDWLSLFLEVSAGRCLTIAPKCNLSGYDIASVELDHPSWMRDMHLAWPTNRKLSRASNYVKRLIIDYFSDHE